MKRISSRNAGKVGIEGKGSTVNAKHPSGREQNEMTILPLIISLRLINTLCVRTFFQPDEYFQSLEPAWQIAFGSQSGAWITWVGLAFIGS
jgi:Alg9-like mannosyltransferase family